MSCVFPLLDYFNDRFICERYEKVVVLEKSEQKFQRVLKYFFIGI